MLIAVTTIFATMLSRYHVTVVSKTIRMIPMTLLLLLFMVVIVMLTSAVISRVELISVMSVVLR